MLIMRFLCSREKKFVPSPPLFSLSLSLSLSLHHPFLQKKKKKKKKKAEILQNALTELGIPFSFNSYRMAHSACEEELEDLLQYFLERIPQTSKAKL